MLIFSRSYLFFSMLSIWLRIKIRSTCERAGFRHRLTITSLISLFRGINVIIGDLYHSRYK